MPRLAPEDVFFSSPSRTFGNYWFWHVLYLSKPSWGGRRVGFSFFDSSSKDDWKWRFCFPHKFDGGARSFQEHFATISKLPCVPFENQFSTLAQSVMMSRKFSPKSRRKWRWPLETFLIIQRSLFFWMRTSDTNLRDRELWFLNPHRKLAKQLHQLFIKHINSQRGCWGGWRGE